MTYVLRHVVDLLAQPLVLMFGLMLVALLLRWRGHRRASLGTAVGAVALLYLCALGPVSRALVAPLESYPALDDARLPQGIAGIAVLGAATVPRAGIPITARIPGDGLARVAEGVRLAKRYGNVRLVLSGGVPPGYGLEPSAHGYAIFARDMGIDPASIVMLDQPLTTSEEARALSKLFGQSPFLLVTSASHMKRAMKLFDGTGARPIAAPTSQRAGSSQGFGGTWLPSSGNLGTTQMALHEYLGILAISAGQG
jgi:uncharacterized SAM-binding protein YcdF (DUF218 family)